MPYCSKCGKEVGVNAQFCPNCGEPQSTGSYNPAYSSQRPTDPNDSDSFGWAILGFVVPVVGLILYLIWAQTRPKSAKMVGLGALVGFIFSIVVSIIYFVVLFALMSTNSTVSILV